MYLMASNRYNEKQVIFRIGSPKKFMAVLLLKATKLRSLFHHLVMELCFKKSLRCTRPFIKIVHVNVCLQHETDH